MQGDEAMAALGAFLRFGRWRSRQRSDSWSQDAGVAHRTVVQASQTHPAAGGRRTHQPTRASVQLPSRELCRHATR